jgi:hypothetical protein
MCIVLTVAEHLYKPAYPPPVSLMANLTIQLFLLRAARVLLLSERMLHKGAAVTATAHAN